MMQFAHPKILFLLIGVIPLIVWYVLKHRNARPSLAISSLSPLARIGKPFRARLLHIPFVLEILAFCCLVVVLARPQTYDSWHSSNIEGTEIVLAMDISTSMLAKDFRPNRLEASKEMAAKFIADREHDNIGVVIFAGESLTGIPMTFDRATATNYISQISSDMLVDGTAIGDGIATSINRLKDGKAKSKSIILLTDGSNNTGGVAPLTAAEIAKSLGIKIYTIGIGTNGMADYPQIDYFGRMSYVKIPVVIDENTLRQIAETTGGKYFRATGNNVLKSIFDEINSLETSVLDVRNFSHTEDNYFLWALAAFLLIGLDIVLRQTYLRTIP